MANVNIRPAVLDLDVPPGTSGGGGGAPFGQSRDNRADVRSQRSGRS